MKVVCHCPTHKRDRQKKSEETREGAEEKEVEEGETSIETVSNVCPRLRGTKNENKGFRRKCRKFSFFDVHIILPIFQAITKNIHVLIEKCVAV